MTTDLQTEELKAELMERLKNEEAARLGTFKQQYEALVKSTGVAIEAYGYLTPDGRVAVAQRITLVPQNQPG